jgi:hypothetical protein
MTDAMNVPCPSCGTTLTVTAVKNLEIINTPTVSMLIIVHERGQYQCASCLKWFAPFLEALTGPPQVGMHEIEAPPAEALVVKPDGNILAMVKEMKRRGH